MEEIIIRDYEPTFDGPFIFDSWRRSYIGQSPFTQFIPRKEFDREHSKVISKLIERSTPRIAVKTEDPDVIVGYIVFEPNILHYVYVKEAFRGFGMCRKLIYDSKLIEGARATHLTMRGKNIISQSKFIYSPYFDL